MKDNRLIILSRLTAGTNSVLLAFLVFGGCDPTPEQQRQTRLDNFLTILPEPIRESFENQKYDLAVEQIETRLAQDSEFAERWATIKKAEAIDLFNTSEVIDYFVDYFVNYRAPGN